MKIDVRVCDGCGSEQRDREWTVVQVTRVPWPRAEYDLCDACAERLRALVRGAMAAVSA